MDTDAMKQVFLDTAAIMIMHGLNGTSMDGDAKQAWDGAERLYAERQRRRALAAVDVLCAVCKREGAALTVKDKKVYAFASPLRKVDHGVYAHQACLEANPKWRPGAQA